MGIADRIRIALGNLTPEEIAERDAAARLRREAAEREAAEQLAIRQAKLNAESERAQEYLDATAKHDERLHGAAAIGSLQLECHADTWKWVHQWMNADRRAVWDMPWSVGGQITKHESGMVTVNLSGPKLVEVLHRLAWVRELPGAARPYKVWNPTATDRPLGVRVYDALAAVIDQVEPDKITGEDLPPAVVDARVAPREEEAAS